MGTSRALRSLRLAFLLLACLTALPAGATEKDVWITIERGALSAFEATEGTHASRQAGASGAGFTSREIVAAPFSERRLGALSAFMHARHQIGPGFVAHPSREDALAEVARAAAAGEPPAEPPVPLVEYTIDNGAVVQALMAEVREAGVRSMIVSLQNVFTRYHRCQSGYNSAVWIKTVWEGYAQGRGDVTVELFNHPPSTTPQPSVILTIPGAPGETGVVVLGGHQDSYAGSNCSTSRSPGADDNASGVAALSEVIRAALFLGYQPQKTVKFMAYAAEEAGLLGSDDIAATYQQQGVNVIGVFNLDMTGYRGLHSPADIYLITDNTDALQNAFVGQLVDTYLSSVRPVGSLRGTTACGYGCSDHASWSSRGYAASFPFEALFSDYDPFIHTANDTLANIGGTASHALQFTRLAAAYMAELAKGDLSAVTASPGPELRDNTGYGQAGPRRQSRESGRGR